MKWIYIIGIVITLYYVGMWCKHMIGNVIPVNENMTIVKGGLEP